MTDVAAPAGAELVDGIEPLVNRSRKTLSHDVLETLREAIVMGRITPGTSLPLHDLSKQLGVSISPVREALRQLEILGLVEHLPYRGTRVSLITLDEMQETYEIRGVLEALAVKRAAERFTEDDAEVCRAALADIDRGYADGDAKAVIQGNTAFHLGIAAAARSATLLRSLAAVCETSERYSASVLMLNPDDLPTAESEGHLRILDACIRHDGPAAEAAIADHMAVFEQMCTERMQATSDG